MRKITLLLTLTITVLVVFNMTSCSQTTIQDYEGTTPELRLEQFFNGNLRAFGILQNRSGKVTRKFSADILASWKNNTGTLDETFYFDDGEVSKRLWTLTDQGNGHYTGTAGDVVGEAKGSVVGSAFNWHYTLSIPYKEKTIDVRLNDWLYLVSEDKLINRTKLTKFGFEVGQLTLVIERVDQH